MSTSAEYPNLSPDGSETGPNLAQVDPPHPLRSAWKTILAAAVLVTAVIAAYWFYIQRPPLAAGQVLSLNVYPVHSSVSGTAGEGMQGAAESHDQVLVFARIRVHNQTNIPLFLSEIAQTVTFSDGSQQSSLAAGMQDFDRVFQAYPATQSWRAEPLRRDITLTPGQTVEGLAIFNYPVGKEQWDAQRAANVSVSFIHQKDLVLSSPR